MSCVVCLNSCEDPLKCEQCTCIVHEKCIIGWYQFGIQKRRTDENIKLYTCPMCRAERSFDVEITDTENNTEVLRLPRLYEGKVLRPENFLEAWENLPQNTRTIYDYIPLMMTVGGIRECIGYEIKLRDDNRQDDNRQEITIVEQNIPAEIIRLSNKSVLNPDEIAILETYFQSGEMPEATQTPEETQTPEATQTPVPKSMDPRYILNPQSGRYVLRRGAIGKRLVAANES